MMMMLMICAYDGQTVYSWHPAFGQVTRKILSNSVSWLCSVSAEFLLIVCQCHQYSCLILHNLTLPMIVKWMIFICVVNSGYIF